MNKQKLIRWKVYLDRSRMYIGYVQFFLIIIISIKSFKSNFISEFIESNIVISIILLLVLFVSFSLVLGYIDSKLGLREEEIKNHSKSNPVLRDLQNSIVSLHQEVKDLNKRIK